MQITASSLILDLLSTLRRGTMLVRALVEAGTMLGIAENSIRVSRARLYASGRIERDERGRTRLGPAVEAISRQLRTWRELSARTRALTEDSVATDQAKLGRAFLARDFDAISDLEGRSLWDADAFKGGTHEDVQ